MWSGPAGGPAKRSSDNLKRGPAARRFEPSSGAERARMVEHAMDMPIHASVIKHVYSSTRPLGRCLRARVSQCQTHWPVLTTVRILRIQNLAESNCQGFGDPNRLHYHKYIKTKFQAELHIRLPPIHGVGLCGPRGELLPRVTRGKYLHGRQKSLLLISGDDCEHEVVAIRNCFHCPHSDSFITSGLFDGC